MTMYVHCTQEEHTLHQRDAEDRERADARNVSIKAVGIELILVEFN